METPTANPRSQDNKMTNEEKYTYWFTHAQYDMDTATAMLASGRRFFLVHTPTVRRPN
jgi:hypothetical protein